MLSLDHDGIVAHIKALALREAADGLDRLAPPYVGLWLRNWADELDLEAGIPGPVVDLVAEWNALPQETRDANVARRTALLAEALDPTRRVED